MSIEISMLYKLRFQQQAKLLATEVSNNGPAGIADILAVKNNKVYEYEVKRSKSDFRNDFRKNSYGVPKHTLYHNREDLQKIQKINYYANMQHFVPDFFYFVVPESMGEFALKYLKEYKYDKYGLIAVAKKNIRYGIIQSSTCIRRAKQLESQASIERVKERITARLSSELVNSKMDYWIKIVEREEE